MLPRGDGVTSDSLMDDLRFKNEKNEVIEISY